MIATKSSLPRIALIGVSGYARIHIEWLLQAYRDKRIAIAAFVSLEAEKDSEGAQQLRETGAQQFDSYQEMLEAQDGQLDLCFIPTGIQWHARMSIDALNAGCNVLVEKPLAGSASDGKAIIEAMEKTGRWVAVGFQDLYTDAAARIKRQITDGRIGKLKTISMLGIWPRPRSYFQRNHWAGRIRADDAFVLDSPLNNALSHFISLSLYFAGESFDKSCDAFLNEAQLYRAHDIESFDTAIIQATSEFGTQFWFGASHASTHTLEPVIRITGSKGRIEWEQDKQCTLSCSGGKDEVIPLDDSFAARTQMFESVLSRLSDPDTRICGPEIALCHTRLIESIHRFGKILDFEPKQIKEIPFEGTDSTVPDVIGLKNRLLDAFEKLGSLKFEEIVSKT
ncbi:Gfo/Idh/MocA family protein [Pelagicoccus mobilis]|uniref:Gfo/Idh/MocA family oxidoreductase n=1 Tax=Pelagicoccus mobilis TaxID=415221 RepID=A0A934RW15_9BACT|nr:Gfo/Idh/MocA family oxidoreductase [Pelagicoccus mobilis]MBK1875457.1 Gfo/Idh/MocA family oxidoreductase [Pelagicoccus mobilis]